MFAEQTKASVAEGANSRTSLMPVPVKTISAFPLAIVCPPVQSASCEAGARSARQIPDDVGDRVRAQVMLHAFAEELNDRPRPGEHADALHLSG
jgi:hypothetical protein